MNYAKFLIILTAGIFTVYGIFFIFIPEKMLYFVTQSTLSTSNGVIDLRATYGGMSLGIGLILFNLSKSDANIRVGLIAVTFLMLGMALGRTLGILIDQQANTIMYIYLALELLASGLALFYLTKSKKPDN